MEYVCVLKVEELLANKHQRIKHPFLTNMDIMFTTKPKSLNVSFKNKNAISVDQCLQVM